MSTNEVAARWLKARSQLREINRDIARLESELKNVGGSLKCLGSLLMRYPETASDIDTQSLSDAVRIGELAERYRALLRDRADMQANIDALQLSG